MMSPRMQRLVAVQAPWMISPSTPYLQLLASESVDPTIVRFVAHFGLEWSSEIGKGKKYVKVGSPYTPETQLAPPGGPFQLVRAQFNTAIASRMLPVFSEREVVNPHFYDFSGLPHRFTPGLSAEKWKLQFNNAWVKSRLCPNPRMYEVSNSAWIKELAAGSEFKHFLLMGHDAYVEVVATHWDWMSEGRIPE